LRYFLFAHLSRMPFMMKKNESFDPVDVALFCFRTVMPRPNRLADLIEQFSFGGDASALTVAVPSNRFLFSRYILALSMLFPPAANAV
jgi:hypothetical protein